MENFTRARRHFMLTLLALVLQILVRKPALAEATQPPRLASGTYVEFLIGDRTEETRKWGHVSLRVVTNGVDLLYDFGRYGKMWGLKNASEGEPVLRVWKSGQFETYRAHHLKDGGTTRRYKFASTAERNSRINSYFARMSNGARVIYSNGTMIAYNSNYKTFHAVEVNCTTVTIAAFMQGFPEVNLNDLNYAEARSLQWYMVAKAQEHDYDRSERHWRHVWWPLDLAALLDEKFVAQARAQVSNL